MSEPNTAQGRWARYVALWNEREPATALALLRIAVGLVFAYDLIYLSCLDLEMPLFGDAWHYNLGFTSQNPTQPLLRRVFGPGPLAVYVLVYGGAAAALLFSAGVLTRASGLLVIFAQIQLVEFYPEGNRGIDQLLRLVVLILVFSRSHETLSVDARVRFGRWARPSALVPAWPRYLVILQLLWLYTSAAISKDHSLWSFRGDYMALFYILRYQHFVRWDMTGVPAWVTQVGAFTTWWFEALAGLMVVACLRMRRDPAATALRTRVWTVFKRVWITVGLGLHTTLLVLMNIGIFTTGMLVLYFCWVSPALLQRLPRTRWLSPFRYEPGHAGSASS